MTITNIGCEICTLRPQVASALKETKNVWLFCSIQQFKLWGIHVPQKEVKKKKKGDCIHYVIITILPLQIHYVLLHKDIQRFSG